MRQVTRKSLITVAAAGGVLALGGGYAQADAGASGTAANSPGVLSGNNVQVPVHVPVNVCGNTVDVIGVLNPAFGNSCANVSAKPSGGGHGGGYGEDGYGGEYGGGHTAPSYGGSHTGGGYGESHPGATHTVPAGGSHGGGAHAGGGAVNSPGVGSGNSIEVPIDIPVNACGNSIDIVGLLNPTFGNGCENVEAPVAPPVGPEEPVVEPNPPGRPGKPTEVRTVTTTPEKPNTPETQNVAKPESPDVLASTGAGGLGVAIPVGAGLLLAGTILYRRARASA
ncbi:chaplin family protein [Streptomyces sp. NPDC087850]|uniref:chaplin n=1 Tax=Streptomyces sp. NPDC087850 TaxID=3365809 RepID=UPI00382E7FA2